MHFRNRLGIKIRRRNVQNGTDNVYDTTTDIISIETSPCNAWRRPVLGGLIYTLYSYNGLHSLYRWPAPHSSQYSSHWQSLGWVARQRSTNTNVPDRPSAKAAPVGYHFATMWHLKLKLSLSQKAEVVTQSGTSMKLQG